MVLLCLDPRNLRRSIGAALVVGTILSLINQADVVFGGRATAGTWAKIGLCFVVPFLVSSYGIVLGSRAAGPDKLPPGVKGSSAD